MANTMNSSIFAAQGTIESSLSLIEQKFRLEDEVKKKRNQGLIKSTASVAFSIIAAVTSYFVRSEVGSWLRDRSYRAIIWAKQRISQSFTEAKQSVFDRIQVSNHVALNQKSCGDTIVSSATPFSPLSVAVGQQLSNDDEPLCPITLDKIPIDRRAIVISCSDRGKPSATIYDQRELFKWLNENCFDPLTEKNIQCVVNSEGTIIYPVRISSEVPKRDRVKTTGPSVMHCIFSPGCRVISREEINDQRRLSSARYKEIEKKMNNLKKNDKFKIRGRKMASTINNCSSVAQGTIESSLLFIEHKLRSEGEVKKKHNEELIKSTASIAFSLLAVISSYFVGSNVSS